MSKKRSITINSDIKEDKQINTPLVLAINPLEQLNRYLPPHVKYTFDEFVQRFPEKVERLVAHANISDETLMGYVKTLAVLPVKVDPSPIEQENILEQTEE